MITTVIVIVAVAWCAASVGLGFAVGAAITLRDRGGPGL